MNRSERILLARVVGVAGIFCVLFGLSGPALAHDWVEWGPKPIAQGHAGRVSALVVSSTDPLLYYTAGADGGIWRTTDGGASWTPLTDHLPTSAMGALAMDPTNEQIIYGGSGEANYANHSRYGLGLYKSVDGGDTWEVLAAETFAGRCFSKIHVNPDNPQRLYASITRAGGFPEMAAAKGYPGATGPVGVFRSDDGGATWTQLTNGLPNLSNLCATDLAVDPTDPNILYACIGRIFGAPENGIYKTTDGGDSWVKLGGGLPIIPVGRISVAVAPSNPLRLYAMYTHPANEAGGNASTLGAYRSDDGGATWVHLPTLGNIQATYGWFLSIVGVHPTDPDMVFMGGVTLHRSTDAGANWSTVTPPHVDMHAIAWDADGRLLIGDDGGVHRSTNNGNSWAHRNHGLGTIQCYAGLSTSAQYEVRLYVGTQDNGSIRRSMPNYWPQMLGGDGGWTQVDQTDANYVFAEYQGTGNLFRSSNGGVSFQAVGSGINPNDRNCFLPPYLIDQSNPLRMLYATHRIYLSTNRGTSWTVYSGDLTGGGNAAIRSLAMAPSDSNVVYAATNDGRVLVSSDGGQNWELILENVPGWPRVTRELFVHPSDPDTVYLAVAYYGTNQIRRSTDRGQTWELLGTNFPDIPVNVVAVDVRGNRPVIYAGTDAGVYRSLNEGASWHRFGNGFPNACVVDLILEPHRKRLIVGTQGRGIWAVAIGLPGDMNGDGSVDGFDIHPFVLALTDPDEYAFQYPEVDPVLNGDMNGDGVLDGFDIQGFVEVIVG